jgi:hypothetical protein
MGYANRVQLVILMEISGGALSHMDLWDVNYAAAYRDGHSRHHDSLARVEIEERIGREGVDERHGAPGRRPEGEGDSKERRLSQHHLTARREPGSVETKGNLVSLDEASLLLYGSCKPGLMPI